MKLLIVRDRAAYLANRSARRNQPTDPQDEFKNVRRWDSILDLDQKDAKSFTEIKDGNGKVIDIQNVKIKGYLSTFENTTGSDRQGDYVVEGAFKETIKEFMRNPVLLADHINMVRTLAGKFTKVLEDKKGLYVEASLTNSPLPEMIDVRFKIAEGTLRALSMGGIFYYKEDGRGIFKVNLWEGSLVAVPANQDALFNVRALNDLEKKYLKTGKSFENFYTFLFAQQHLQNFAGVAA